MAKGNGWALEIQATGTASGWTAVLLQTRWSSCSLASLKGGGASSKWARLAPRSQQNHLRISKEVKRMKVGWVWMGVQYRL